MIALLLLLTCATPSPAPQGVRDVAGVAPEVEEAPVEVVRPPVDPLADEDLFLGPPQSPSSVAVARAKAARQDRAVVQALIVGLGGAAVGVGVSIGVAFLLVPAGAIVVGVLAVAVLLASPTVALLLLAPDAHPATPWLAGGAWLVGGVVGALIGLFIYEQTWRFFIRGDVVGGPIDLLPVATTALGAFGGIALVSVFVAGRDPDE